MSSALEEKLVVDDTTTTTNSNNTNTAVFVADTVVDIEEEQEPLLRESLFPFTFYPIEHRDVYEFYRKQEASTWKSSEIHPERDLNDWKNKLSVAERNFIQHVLGYFACADGIVCDNLNENFLAVVQMKEAKAFWTCQSAMECIHAEVYSKTLNALLENNTIELEKCFNIIEALPATKRKIYWMKKWASGTASFGERIIAFIIIEGIFFSASFAAIFWLKERGVMPSLIHLNKFIARDENLHCEFGCLLYNKYLVNKPNRERILEMVLEAVSIETDFIRQVIPENLIGMNATKMSQYVKFVAYGLLSKLNITRIDDALEKVENPFKFMEAISVDARSNFFEREVAEYGKANVMSTPSEMEFNTTGDF